MSASPVPRRAGAALILLAAAALGQDQPSPGNAPPKPPAEKPAPQDPGTPPEAPISKPGGPPPASPASPPQGDLRQQMWPAPTAEDWKKPCLITWQRTWDDAVQVSKETGKAILICVNMDGEIASEHYAGVRYRQPEIAKLYEPYVCVIASVYRHTPRDYDDQGRRIPCPRFGGVTCGEHIAIEPIVYEKYLDGQRVSPRHIMVELDGKESFDVFYANDTASVFKTIEDGIAQRKGAPPPQIVKGDRPVTERVASRDVVDRTAVEAAYAEGDAARRKALLDAATRQGAAAPLELLRLAVFGLDVDAAAAARRALAQAESPAAVDLISDALRVPMPDAEREALVAALERIGQSTPRALWLASVHRGLAAKGSVDAASWTKTVHADASAQPSAVEWYALEGRRHDSELARRTKPEDPAAWLDFAEVCLALARKTTSDGGGDPKMSRAFSRLMLEDARNAALTAEKLKASGWRLDAALALADYYDGRVDEAYPRAEAAVKAMPSGEPGWNAMAVLTVFAESRFKAIREAVRQKKPWPPQWIADVNATYAVLLQHPLATDAQVVWHLDFLGWLGAFERAGRVLDQGLARFPESAVLHERLRARVLKLQGVDGLEPVYDAKLAAKDASPRLERFAAMASLMTAEFHRRQRHVEQALAAYGRAIGHFDRASADDPEYRDAADQSVALALAARARMRFEADDDEGALADIVASFERRPASAGTLDGLGITPASTAQALAARLRERKKDELLAKLTAAMENLDPTLLVPKNE